jgi:hypothetical protein
MTTHYMAFPLTKAFMLQYEEEQERLEHQIKENIKPRIPQTKSSAQKSIATTSNATTSNATTSNATTSILINILPPLITIHIKTATGKSICLKINPIDTILQLKKQLYLKEDLSIESQRIIFGGKQLEDHHTLCHYNITNESVLHIILRLRGGMFHKSSSRADFISLNHSDKMERGLSMLNYMKQESTREMFVVLEDFEEMLKNTKNDVEIDMVYELIRKIYSE